MLQLNQETITLIGFYVKPQWVKPAMNAVLKSYEDSGRARFFSHNIPYSYIRPELGIKKIVASITLELDSREIFEDVCKPNIWYNASKFDGNPSNYPLVQKRSDLYDESIRYIFIGEGSRLHSLDDAVEAFMYIK